MATLLTLSDVLVRARAGAVATVTAPFAHMARARRRTAWTPLFLAPSTQLPMQHHAPTPFLNAPKSIVRYSATSLAATAKKAISNAAAPAATPLPPPSTSTRSFYQPESPFQDQPPAYSHLVFPGGDAKAASMAFHHIDSNALHVLRIRLEAREPSSTSPPSPSSRPLLVAEGDITKEGDTIERPTMTTTTTTTTAAAAAAHAPRKEHPKPLKVWCTRAWIGNGPGQREATYGVLAEGLAAAYALGLKNMQVCVPSAQMAREICGVTPLNETSSSSSSSKSRGKAGLQAAHQKIQSSIRHFPSFSVWYDHPVDLAEGEGAGEGGWVEPVPELRGNHEDWDHVLPHLPSITLTPTATVSPYPPSGSSSFSSSFSASSSSFSNKQDSLAPPPEASPISDARPAAAAVEAAVAAVADTAAAAAAATPPIDPKAEYILRFDGAARGNPGPAGAGAAVFYKTPRGRAGRKVRGVAVWLGSDPPVTNNEAEYQGLIAGLRMAKNLGIRKVCVEGDSLLAIRQMLGEYNVKNERLEVLYREAMALKDGFEDVSFKHVRRAMNPVADALANQALDEEKSGTFGAHGLRIDAPPPVPVAASRRVAGTGAAVGAARGEGIGRRGFSTSATADTPSAHVYNPTAEYLLQFDGGSRGNPGPGGAGVVIYEKVSQARVRSLALWFGDDPPLTNNEAEYRGLIEGLRAAKALGIRRLCVEGDSLLVVKQIMGEYKVRNERLKVLHAEAIELKDSFPEFEIRHVERALNSEADAMANQALDEQRSGTFGPLGQRLEERSRG